MTTPKDTNTWQETVANTVAAFLKSRRASTIIKNSGRPRPPEEYMGAIYHRIVSNKTCALQFPEATQEEVKKRVTKVARYYLLNGCTEERNSRTTQLDAEYVPDAPVELKLNLEELVAELPDPLRRVIRSFLRGKSQTEIADDVKKHPGTVSRRFSAAVKILRESAIQN